jgi:ATP-binding cassette, subfamily B, bacterial MsbA
VKSFLRLSPYLRSEVPAFVQAALYMLVLALATGAYAFLVGPALRFVFAGADALTSLHHLAPWLSFRIDPKWARAALPLLLVAVGSARAGAYLGQFHLMGMIGQRVMARLRRDFIGKLVDLGPAYHDNRHSAELISRFASDMDHIERATTYALAWMVRDSLQVAVLVGVAIAMDWRLSLIAFGVLPLAAVPVSRFAKRLRRHADTGAKSLGRLTERVSEGLGGIRIVQAYGLRDVEVSRFDAEAAEYLQAQRRAVRIRAATSAALEILSVVGLAVTLAVATRAVIAGAAAPERLLSFAATIALLAQPARDLGRVGPLLTVASASCERVFDILDARATVVGGSAASEAMKEGMSFDNVTFGYDGGRPVLDGVSFRIRRGERVALVGASGAGKSTIASLALRFRDPQQGQVTVDGVDLRVLTLESARKNFALVTQEPLLFAGTVRANLLLARPSASDSEVRAAADAALASEFIDRLPGKLDAPLGERGVTLSGGQRQRIALARAILSGAPMLVLDEATSSLDEESQREVQRALDAVLAERTALVIAHRLSSVRSVDRILVLKDGRIVEEGKHEELVARGGEYSRLYQAGSHG